jgi:hypothetical protein
VGKNQRFLNIKAGETYSYHCGFKELTKADELILFII